MTKSRAREGTVAKGDVVMKFDAETAAFVTAVQNARAKLIATGDDAEKAGKQFDKLGEGMLKIGKETGKQVADAMGIPLSPADALRTAIGTVTEALDFMNQQAERGAQSLQKLEGPSKSLVQITSNLMEMQKARGQAMALASKYGLTNEQAIGLMVSARNRGMEGESDLFGQVSSFTARPEGMVDAVADLQDAFGKQKSGGARTLMNQLLAGAEKSKLNLENFAEPTVSNAGFVSSIGGSPEELMGSMSVLSGVLGTGERAAMRIGRGAATFKKMGLDKEGGLIGAFKKFQQLPEDERKKAAGESMEMAQFVEAFGSNLGDIEQRTKEIGAAGRAPRSADYVARSVDIAERDPYLSSVKRERATAAAREAAEMPYGESRLRAEARINEAMTNSIQSGDRGLTQSLKLKGLRSAQYVLGDEAINQPDQVAAALGSAGAALPSGGLGGFAVRLVADLTKRLTPLRSPGNAEVQGVKK
jgi:hypothetical protein